MFKKKGKLILISGPMYAGKTRQLISWFNEEFKNKKIVAFTPNFDNRTKTIESRNGQKINSISIKDTKEIYAYSEETEVIFIDEFHFFSNDLTSVIKKLLKKEKTIIVSGLDRDFKKNKFSLYSELSEITDHEVKMTAVCQTCRKVAKYSRKDSSKGDLEKQIEVDNFENTQYFSACNDCHKV